MAYGSPIDLGALRASRHKIEFLSTQLASRKEDGAVKVNDDGERKALPCGN